MKIPSAMGRIEEIHEGLEGKPRIILLQDAHSVPDAQRHIAQILDRLQDQYAFKFAGIEGAYGPFDAQLLRNFPDQSRLRSLLQSYLEKGELSGPVLSWIMGAGLADFEGVEDWDLYQSGYQLFREASSAVQASEEIQKKETLLRDRKKQIFSAELFELDQKLEAFRKNQEDLLQVLQSLSKYSPPPIGSDLELVLKSGAKQSSEDIKPEILKAMEQVSSFLEHLENPDVRLEISKQFQEQKQAYLTGRIPGDAFASALQEILPTLEFSENLKVRIFSHRRLRGLEGSRFFNEFESYSGQTLRGLADSDDQRKLLHESELLERTLRLASLELSRKDWEEIRADSATLSPELEPARAFYANAVNRENAIVRNFLRSLESRKLKSGILVLGGFHAQGVARILRDLGVSYAMVRPEMTSVPEKSVYKAQMNGSVSWAQYLKPADGKINLYQAFVRAVRDELLRGSENSGLLLKTWRDRVILDMSRENKISQAGSYLDFLDEVSPVSAVSVKRRWLDNIGDFVRRVRSLDQQGKLTESNVFQILGVSGIPVPHIAAAAAPRSELRDLPSGAEEKKLPALRMARSEVRAESQPSGQPAEKEETPDWASDVFPPSSQLLRLRRLERLWISGNQGYYGELKYLIADRYWKVPGMREFVIRLMNEYKEEGSKGFDEAAGELMVAYRLEQLMAPYYEIEVQGVNLNIGFHEYDIMLYVKPRPGIVPPEGMDFSEGLYFVEAKEDDAEDLGPLIQSTLLGQVPGQVRDLDLLRNAGVPVKGVLVVAGGIRSGRGKNMADVMTSIPWPQKFNAEQVRDFSLHTLVTAPFSVRDETAMNNETPAMPLRQIQFWVQQNNSIRELFRTIFTPKYGAGMQGFTPLTDREKKAGELRRKKMEERRDRARQTEADLAVRDAEAASWADVWSGLGLKSEQGQPVDPADIERELDWYFTVQRNVAVELLRQNLVRFDQDAQAAWNYVHEGYSRYQESLTRQREAKPSKVPQRFKGRTPVEVIQNEVYGENGWISAFANRKDIEPKDMMIQVTEAEAGEALRRYFLPYEESGDYKVMQRLEAQLRQWIWGPGVSGLTGRDIAWMRINQAISKDGSSAAKSEVRMEFNPVPQLELSKLVQGGVTAELPEQISFKNNILKTADPDSDAEAAAEIESILRKALGSREFIRATLARLYPDAVLELNPEEPVRAGLDPESKAGGNRDFFRAYAWIRGQKYSFGIYAGVLNEVSLIETQEMARLGIAPAPGILVRSSLRPNSGVMSAALLEGETAREMLEAGKIEDAFTTILEAGLSLLDQKLTLTDGIENPGNILRESSTGKVFIVDHGFFHPGIENFNALGFGYQTAVSYSHVKGEAAVPFYTRLGTLAVAAVEKYYQMHPAAEDVRSAEARAAEFLERSVPAAESILGIDPAFMPFGLFPEWTAFHDAVQSGIDSLKAKSEVRAVFVPMDGDLDRDENAELKAGIQKVFSELQTDAGQMFWDARTSFESGDYLTAFLQLSGPLRPEWETVRENLQRLSFDKELRKLPTIPRGFLKEDSLRDALKMMIMSNPWSFPGSGESAQDDQQQAFWRDFLEKTAVLKPLQDSMSLSSLPLFARARFIAEDERQAQPDVVTIMWTGPYSQSVEIFKAIDFIRTSLIYLYPDYEAGPASVRTSHATFGDENTRSFRLELNLKPGIRRSEARVENPQPEKEQLERAFGHLKGVLEDSRFELSKILDVSFEIEPEKRSDRVFRIADFGTSVGDFLPNIAAQLQSLGYALPQVEGFETTGALADAAVLKGYNVRQATVNAQGDLKLVNNHSGDRIVHDGKYDLLFFNAWDPSKRGSQGFGPLFNAFKKYAAGPESLGFVRLYDGPAISDYEKLEESRLLAAEIKKHAEIHHVEFDSLTTPELARGRSPLGPLILISLKDISVRKLRSELRSQNTDMPDWLARVKRLEELVRKAGQSENPREHLDELDRETEAGAALLRSLTPNFDDYYALEEADLTSFGPFQLSKEAGRLRQRLSIMRADKVLTVLRFKARDIPFELRTKSYGPAGAVTFSEITPVMPLDSTGILLASGEQTEVAMVLSAPFTREIEVQGNELLIRGGWFAEDGKLVWARELIGRYRAGIVHLGNESLRKAFGTYVNDELGLPVAYPELSRGLKQFDFKSQVYRAIAADGFSIRVPRHTAENLDTRLLGNGEQIALIEQAVLEAFGAWGTALVLKPDQGTWARGVEFLYPEDSAEQIREKIIRHLSSYPAGKVVRRYLLEEKIQRLPILTGDPASERAWSVRVILSRNPSTGEVDVVSKYVQFQDRMVRAGQDQEVWSFPEIADFLKLEESEASELQMELVTKALSLHFLIQENARETPEILSVDFFVTPDKQLVLNEIGLGPGGHLWYYQTPEETRREFGSLKFDPYLFSRISRRAVLSRSETRAYSEPGNPAGELTALAMALYPESGSVQTRKAEVRAAVARVVQKRINLEVLEQALRRAVDQALIELQPEIQVGESVHTVYAPMIDAMLSFFRQKMEESASDSRKVTLALDFSEIEMNGFEKTRDDYIEVLTRYFSNEIEGLIIRGGLNAEMTEKIRASGIRLSARKQMEKISGLALVNQKVLPLVRASAEVYQTSNKILWPVGIRYDHDSGVNAEAAVMARFNQILFGILSALLVRQPGDAEKLRSEFLRALALRKQYSEAAESVISFDEQGHAVINARALQILMAAQAARLTERSA